MDIKEALVPKLVVDFSSWAPFEVAVLFHGKASTLEDRLAGIVSVETKHQKNGETIQFDPDKQVDVVLRVPGETMLGMRGLTSMYVKSDSLVLCTLESFDFGDMPRRLERIGSAIKHALRLPSSANLQMRFDEVKEGHWVRIR